MDNRPLSPHITVHKWILSQIMSILHRATAIGFSIGLLFISLWLVSFSLGPEYYSIFQFIFFNLFGKIIIVTILSCFIFHFTDEIRKLFWAFSIGLDLMAVKVTSYIIIVTSLLMICLISYFLL